MYKKLQDWVIIMLLKSGVDLFVFIVGRRELIGIYYSTIKYCNIHYIRDFLFVYIRSGLILITHVSHVEIIHIHHFNVLNV